MENNKYHIFLTDPQPAQFTQSIIIPTGVISDSLILDDEILKQNGWSIDEDIRPINETGN